jgi:hypothetical protein
MVSRTQAGQTQLAFEAPRLLADTACASCGTLGVAIIVMGTNANGAIEAAFCGHDCARRQGWPWLASEASPKGKSHAP